MGSSNFNLEQSIQHYISLIKAQGSVTTSDVAELTAHLYDAIDNLKTKGLTEEEAFTIASKRLGDEAILTQEYSKVNVTVKTNKMWAYLFVGFNLFYSLPSILFTVLPVLYFLVYQHFETANAGVLIITTLHLLFCIFIWFIVKHKLEISNFITQQIEQNSVRFVLLSFLPFLLKFILPIFFVSSYLYQGIRNQVYEFDSSLVEFSYYLVILALVAGTLSLVFSINNSTSISLKSLFQKPSALFLVSFGILIEMLAASTRAFQFTILTSAFVFGSIYFIASFLISFYNRRADINRCLIIALVLGVVLELGFGFKADLMQGRHHTIYFGSCMLLGILLGRYLGVKLNNESAVIAPQLL